MAPPKTPHAPEWRAAYEENGDELVRIKRSALASLINEGIQRGLLTAYHLAELERIKADYLGTGATEAIEELKNSIWSESRLEHYQPDDPDLMDTLWKGVRQTRLEVS